MTVTTSPQSDAPENGPPGLWERFDRTVYAVEYALVVGGLAVMTLTYFLTVIFSNVQQTYNKFDIALVRLAGYPDTQQAPKELLEDITTWWSPLLLGAITLLLACLAVRTREKMGAKDDTPAPPVRPGVIFLKGVAVTAALYGFMLLVEVIPARFMGLTSLALLIGLLVARGRLSRSYVHITAGVVGGACMALYFWLKMGEGYGKNAGLSAVLLMYVAFIGASMATREGRHIRVDAVRKAIKGKGYHLYEAISLFVTILFTAFLFVMALRYLDVLADTGVNHEQSDLPQFVVVLPITTAFLLIVARFLVQLGRAVKAWLRGEPAPAPQVELH